MSSRRTVVFDTNVIISTSLNANSTSAVAFRMAIDEATILLSTPTLREIRDVIMRDKFDHYVSRKKRGQLLHGLIREAEFLEPRRKVSACRDPDDNKYLRPLQG